MDAQVRQQIEMTIAGIDRGGTPAERVDWSTGEVLAGEAPAAEALAAGPDMPPEPFSRWLAAQKGREDWIDELAAAARKDPAFPKHASPDEVRRYLERKNIADPDVFEQLEDAERVWASL